MSLNRRRFLRLGGLAYGAAALNPKWVLGGRVDPSAIAVVGAAEETAYGRGAILGLEEAERSAELLRRPVRVVRADAADGRGFPRMARELRDRGVVAVVGALPEGEHGPFERAMASVGLIVLDARPVRPESTTVPDVFRTGLPATAYGLALLTALVAAEPGWRWGVVAEETAARQLLDRVRAVLGSERWPMETQDGSTALPVEAFDAVVRVWGGRGGDSGGSGRPVVRIDPSAFRPPPPVAGRSAVLWDDALFRYGAEQLNDRFIRRFGVGMTDGAWSAWMAVKALSEAVLRSRTASRAEVVHLLGGDRAAFDGHKGGPLSFSAGGGALAQPLYVVGGAEGPVEVDWWTVEEPDEQGF